MVGRLPDSVWEERRQFVARTEASGLPLSTFAKREGTSWYTLRGWRRRLAEMDGKASIRMTDGQAPALAVFAEMIIESKAKDLSAEDRQILRQKEALPVLTELRSWLDASLSIEPKSPLGKAIGYTLELWSQLNVYTTDDRIPIENNAVERAIRPAAIGRNNWLFAGSERGAAAATFFTLIDSARRAGAKPLEYLTDILSRLPGLPAAQLEDLIPDVWQRAKAASAAK